MICSKIATTDFPARAWQQAYIGAKNGSMRSFNRLIEIADPTIKKFARNYTKNPHDFKDFCQSARYYIVQVINNKDISLKKAKNYFLKSIKMTIKQEKEKLRKRAERYEHIETNFDNEGKDISKINQIKDPRAAKPDLIAYLDEILTMITNMPEKERKIMQFLLSEGNKKSKEIAEELGISVAYVDKKRQRAREYLLEKVKDLK